MVLKLQRRLAVRGGSGVEQKSLFDWAESEEPRLLHPDEIFERASEELLRSLKEDRRIERKPAALGGSSLAEYVCMWANTSPDGGLICLGILNDGQFEGCLKLSIDQVNDREKVGHVFCPEAKLSTKHVMVTNRQGQKDFVLLIRVAYNENAVIKTNTGKVFIRKGESKCELKTPEEIRELQADKGEVSFEQQPCRGLNYPADFKELAAIQYVGKVRKARGIAENLSVAEVLELRRLGKRVGGVFVPNVACALLFAKDATGLIPGCKVRFQRFEGEEEKTGDQYNAVRDEIFEGCVSDLIQQVEKALDSQLRVFSPLDAKGKFFPVLEYPKHAWYEAVVNACVHRSYGNGMMNMPIFVKMFDDRLVIESPGPFPPFVTPDNIYDMHVPRNPHMMDALFYLDLVKCAHEGTRRIRDTMAAMKLPSPEWKQSEIGHSIVRVTLRNNIKQRRQWIDRDVGKIVSEAIAADLTEQEIRALNWAAEHGTITISDAQKLLDTHWQSSKRILFGLAKKRIFQYVRFKPFGKDVRDPQAFFRLRSNYPLPSGAFEQPIADETPKAPKTTKTPTR